MLRIKFVDLCVVNNFQVLTYFNFRNYNLILDFFKNTENAFIFITLIGCG